MPLGMEVGLGPGHNALDGGSAPQKGDTDLQFSAHVCCGKTAGWVMMPLGTELGRPRPRRLCVRWGPSPPPKGGTAPIVAHVYCGQTAGWIKMPLGTEIGLGPGDIVLDMGPTSPERAQQPPLFVPCLL